MRKPFQGVWNIVRFNRHYYIISLVFLMALFFSKSHFPERIHLATNVLLSAIIIINFISLSISFYIYDFSNLYSLDWIDAAHPHNKEEIININAGFDEISVLLVNKFPSSVLTVLDFYDPALHTEISIKRARTAYPPFPNTISITSSDLPLKDNSADKIYTILSAHEIRDDMERIQFFKELNRVIKPHGQIIVTEHLRDPANFLAYNIGFFHFHTKATWLSTFKSAELTIEKEIKITPFITTFILNKNGTTS